MKKKNKWVSPVHSGLILIVYVVLSLFLFFLDTRQEVSNTVQDTLVTNINLQAQNIKKIIEQQENTLESISEYVSRQQILVDESALEVIDSFAQNSILSRIYVMDTNGIAYVNNGNVYNVSDRDYFQNAMKGEKTIAQPLNSVIEDEYRLVITIPIIRDQNIIGAIGGSFNLSDIHDLLYYSSEYEKQGYSFLMSNEGNLISIENEKMGTGSTNFFTFFKDATFGKNNLEDVRKILKSDTPHCIEINKNGDIRYMVIAPMKINNWVIGYVIPVEVAEKPYSFIGDNEMILFLEIGSGFIIYLLYIVKITKNQQKKLIKQASIDLLTGFYNKISMQRVVEEYIHKKKTMAILLLDLDDFKVVNDNYGHFIGDEVLVQISDCIRHTLRKDDVVGRIGGDEIMIMLKGVDNKEIVHKKCDELINKISMIKFKQGFSVSCSIGVVYYPKDATTFDELYKMVDVALYEAKATGKRKYREIHGVKYDLEKG